MVSQKLPLLVGDLRNGGGRPQGGSVSLQLPKAVL